MVSALILIADGTEEIEFTITYDTLVRAGIDTTSAFVSTGGSSEGRRVPSNGDDDIRAAKCSRGIGILPDVYFEAERCGPDTFDALVIPGGAKGTETISTDLGVQNLIRKYIRQGKIVGMICAGSLAALTSKLERQPLTSHPSVKGQLEGAFDYKEDPVVVSNKLVTSRGPGTAFPFALTLVELLCGKEKRQEVYAPMVFPSGTPW